MRLLFSEIRHLQDAALLMLASELHTSPGLTEWLGLFLCQNAELILPLTLPLGEGA